MLAHDALELAVTAALGSGDADVANFAGGFHLEKRMQMRFPRQEIMNLHKIEARDAPLPAGPLDLAATCGGRRNPDFVGREQSVRTSELRKAVSDHVLRGAVHR